MARRLIGTEPALHAEVDRLRAEGELRVAVAAPLLVFLVVVTLHSDPGSHINAAFLAVVIAVVIAVAIILEGRARFEAANDFLVDLLVIGEKVNLPTLERLTEQAKTGSWHPLPER